uniref:Uncharacterized protein n=1 Tax=Romanomermis culicivorax TaxID=13658 RepID=A0A915JPL2_ROMCU
MFEETKHQEKRNVDKNEHIKNKRPKYELQFAKRKAFMHGQEALKRSGPDFKAKSCLRYSMQIESITKKQSVIQLKQQMSLFCFVDSF